MIVDDSPGLTYQKHRTSRLGSDLSNGKYLKMRQAFYANPSFVRVYENDHLLEYDLDWVFTSEGGSGLQRVSGLNDGIELANAGVSTNTYTLEILEAYSGVTPTLYKWRNDGKKMRRTGIRYRSIVKGNPDTLVSISMNDPFDYVASYTGGDKQYYFADRVGVGFWGKGEDLEGDLKIEVYKYGRRKTPSFSDNISNVTSDSVFVPCLSLSTNEIDLTDQVFHGGSNQPVQGYWIVRLRDRATNTLSNWSVHKIKEKMYGVWDPGYTTRIGGYQERTLVV